MDFLQPWWVSLRACLGSRVPHSNAFYASFCCHFEGGPYHSLVRVQCRISVTFPVPDTSEQNQLQRVREALELFTVLATVDNARFTEFVAEVLTTDELREEFCGSNRVLQPIWECYLSDTLTSQSPAVASPFVTWGQLFGCPEDPNIYSGEFRDVMDKLKALGPSETDLGEARTSVDWTVKHEVGPLKGSQKDVDGGYSKMTLDSFSRQLGKVFEQRAPPLAQWRAARDGAALLEAWRQTLSGALPLLPVGDVQMTNPNLALTAGVKEVTEVLAQTEMECFVLTFDNTDDDDAGVEDEDGHENYSPQQLAIATMNAGFLLSAVICGLSLTGTRPALDKQVSPTKLKVVCYSASDTMLASVCSAMAASPVHISLDFHFVQPMSPARWGWIVFALCSKPARNANGELKIISYTLPLTKEYVSIAAEVLKNCYPEPAIRSTTYPDAEYGFIDIEEGVKLQPRGLLNDDDNTLVLSRSCCCRTFYNPATMKNNMEVIVPGYGVYEMSLDADSRAMQFVPDKFPTTTIVHSDRSSCIRSLSLKICSIESASLLKELLMLIGGGLRYLSLNYTGNGRVSLRLDDLAAACPELEKVMIDSFVVSLTGDSELWNWGVKDLTIKSSEEIRGLPDCLRDSSYRMSRELWRLQLVLRGARREYVESLQALDEEFVSVTKTKFPLRSKAAMLSVMAIPDNTRPTSKSIRLLDANALTLIFTFAATPQQRLVQIAS